MAAPSSFSRRESNLTLEGDDLESAALTTERIATPWMSRELFRALWANAPAQLASSCSFTGATPPSAATATGAAAPADAASAPSPAFRPRLLRALGDDVVVFEETQRERVDGYASVTDGYALRTVLLVRLEQLHGSDQVAIAVRSTDPVARTRMTAFMSLLQQRLQPGAPPRRPSARHGDTSAVFLEDPGAVAGAPQRVKESGPDTPPAAGTTAAAIAPRRLSRARSHTVRYRSGAGISFEGYLNKKSDLLSSWRATYCVLEGDALAFYESREDFISNAKLVGRVQVQGVEDDSLGKPNGFRVRTEGHRAVHLSSRTGFEKEQWKRAIKVAMTKAPEASAPHVAFGSQPLDVPKFYRLLGALLCQHVSDLSLLFQSIHPDVVVTSNLPPIVPFWGQYRRYDGVLLFISTLLESVDVESFDLLDVLELVRGDADCVDAGDTTGGATATATAARADGQYAVSPVPSATPPPLLLSGTPTPAWEKRVVVTGKETFLLRNHSGRRLTQLFVHELWLDHKHRLVRWHMNGDAVALSVAFDDAARGENIRLVLPGEASASAHAIPAGTFYVQILRALQLHPVEQQGGSGNSSGFVGQPTPLKPSGKKTYPVYVRCILKEGTHQERTLDGLDFSAALDDTAKARAVASSAAPDKRRPSTGTRLFRGLKRATGTSGERSFAPFGDPSGCVTHICKATLEVDPAAGGAVGSLSPQWASNLRLAFPGCARGFTYFLKVEVFQSRFMLPDEVLGVCKINLTPHLSLVHGSADAKANGALPRWHNLCDQYNDCKESWAPPTVFRGRVQVGVIFAPTVASAGRLQDPALQPGKRHSFGSRSTSGADHQLDRTDPLRRINSDQTLIQSMSAELLREFLRGSERPETLGQLRVEGGGGGGGGGGRFVVQSSSSSTRSPHTTPSSSGNPQESEVEGQLKRLARTNHVFPGKRTVFDVPTKYELIKVVGAGTYGEVIAASDVDSGTTVAIKKITNAFADLPDTKRILREMCLLRQLAHPHVVRLHDILRPERRAYLEDIYLVMDLMETDLHRVIHSTQTLTDEHEAAQKWLQRQRRRARIPFAELYPNANCLALDLLEKLLELEPAKRLTASAALRHPYLMEAFRSAVADGAAISESAMRYDSAEEAEDTFRGRIDDAHERVQESKEAMQEAVFEQVCRFHPDAAEYERLVAQHDQAFCVDPVTGTLVPMDAAKARGVSE
ncbi:hypothetical protein PybrP1_010165 [[Pythium] brassicae (nom. inval.)]|nr:hypothetical protein PybrP1_010165 [[Pythium] brassicae (nom. inval.)]